MRFVFALIIVPITFFVAVAGDHWKITSRGHSSVWAVNSTCPCTDCKCTGTDCLQGKCPTIQPAAKPVAQQLPDAPKAVETVTSSTCANGSCVTGTCSSGNCGGQSTGLFRRRR